MNPETLIKCPCNHCSGHIEFESQHAGAVVACPHCGLDTILFIPAIVRRDEVYPPVIPPAAEADPCYFNQGGIAVTKTRLMIGNQLFALANISSFRTAKSDPIRIGPVCALGFGLLLFLGQHWTFFLMAALICLAALAWLFLQKPTFSLIITGARGEATLFSTKDGQFVLRVVQALNQAIIARG